MADLIIRGLYLGNTMSSCPFHADDGYGDDYCAAGHIDCHAHFDERPEDCPVTILKKGHGRLIDADALISVLDILKDKGCDGPIWEQMRDIVENMVTIVPAEGGAVNA